MRKRKNGFWTFVFSFIPGCAEMYMGFMKMGLSLMVAFFVLWALAAWLGSDIMVFVAIVAWFYSFFHARNMASMSDAELQQTEDVYLYHIPQDFKGPNFSEKSRKWIAILLIIFGVILLYRNVIYFLEDVFEIIPYEVYLITDRLPQVAVAVVIIVLGVKLISGKRQELTRMGAEETADYADDRSWSRESGTAEETGKESSASDCGTAEGGAAESDTAENGYDGEEDA